jgi:histone deacetylase 6
MLHRPELLATPDPVTGVILPHNAITTDPVRAYIDWAISNGFGVLDINFPSYLTNRDDGPGFQPKLSEAELQNQTKELLCYLWDNYLEVFASKHIVLMGVGDAYLGVKQLLTFRGKFSFPSPNRFLATKSSTPSQTAAPKSPASSPSSPALSAP